jgi:uncharacterized membrane protein
MRSAVEGLTEAAGLFAGMFLLLAAGLAVARRWRRRRGQRARETHALMANFRELHRRGGLSDEEFRTIRSKLAAELRSEIKDEAGAG